jgi:hypothetical protein
LHLRKDEVGKVRVGSSNVVLQCLQIGANSVVVRLRGSEQTTELFLGEPPRSKAAEASGGP